MERDELDADSTIAAELRPETSALTETMGGGVMGLLRNFITTFMTDASCSEPKSDPQLLQDKAQSRNREVS